MEQQHSAQQSHYQLMTDHNLALRHGHQNLGETMKTKRHARLFIASCILMLDFANAVVLGTQGGLPRASASTVEGRHIQRYPQAVDKSIPMLIKGNHHLWITHAEQLITIIWSKKQIKAFKKIIWLESRWNPTAYNPATNAYGLGQLVNSKPYTKGNPYKQINAAAKYIFNRYGTPNKALAHHNKYGWY